jgi:hypothetical protein
VVEVRPGLHLQPSVLHFCSIVVDF